MLNYVNKERLLLNTENGERATESISRMLCHEKATMFGIVTSIILSEHMSRIISLRKMSVLLSENFLIRTVGFPYYTIRNTDTGGSTIDIR